MKKSSTYKFSHYRPGKLDIHFTVVCCTSCIKMIGIGICDILWKILKILARVVIGMFLLWYERDMCLLIDLVIWRQLVVASRSYCHSNEIRRNYGFTQTAQIELGSLQMIKCYDENVKTPRFLSKHVTSEQKMLSSWNKIPTEDKITAIAYNFVFKS